MQISTENNRIEIKEGCISSLEMNNITLTENGNEPLFIIELNDTNTGQTYTVSALQQDNNKFKCLYKSSEENKYFIDIHDLQNENLILQAEAWIEEQNHDLYFRFAVNNLCDRYTVERIWYPIIPLEKLSSSAAEDNLLVPYTYGQVIENPHEERVRKMGYGSDMFDVVARCRYPSKHCSIQMTYYYNNEGGILFMVPDESRVLKEIVFDRPADKLRAAFLHYPPVEWQKEKRKEISYPVRLSRIEGDWYDAAQSYRDWALSCAWADKSVSIKERNDIPDWFKNLPHWVRTPKDVVTSWKDMIGWPVSWAKAVGGPMAVHVYGWDGKGGPRNSRYPVIGPPREEFPEMVKTFHENDIYLFPYTNVRIACTSGPEWDNFKDEMALQKNGDYSSLESWGQPTTDREEFESAKKAGKKVRAKNYAGIEEMVILNDFTVACFYSEKWQENIKYNTMNLLLEHGVDGVYQDQLGCGHLQCYSTEHGHQPGDPAIWRIGTDKIYSSIRAEIKKKETKAPLVSEYIAEDLIPMINGGLTISPALIMYHKPVPLFQAVYHTHYSCYGWAEDMPAYLETNKYHYLQQLMMPFIFGSQLGWLSYTIPMLLKDHPDIVDCYKEMVTLRKKYPEMLCYGKLLRTPEISGIDSELSPTPNPDRGIRQHNFKKVFSTCFKDEESDTAIAVFCNWTAESQSGKAIVDLSELQIIPDSSAINDSVTKISISDNSAAIEFDIQPTSITAVVFKN